MTIFGYIRLFSHSNSLLVSHVRNVMEAAGIACELRNMTLGGGAGELPLNECEPEVWVAARHFERADALLHEVLQGANTALPPWCCQACDEVLDGVFDTCWQCGTPRAN